jgi:hypothetical protein
MNRIRLWFASVVVMVLAPVISVSHSPSAQGRITLQVAPMLSIQPVTQMQFSISSPGSPALTIEPQGEGSAEFLIVGEPNAAYQIQIPEEVNLISADSQPDTLKTADPIRVRSFKSLPAATGLLGQDGQQTLFIGATRESIPLQQKEGTYTGTYTVTILY